MGNTAGVGQVTIKDVAAAAGVSVGTVSRYLNGFAISPQRRERIQAAIQALGYRGNYMAKALKSRKSMTIGVLIYTLTDPFSTTIVSSFQRVVEERGYSIILADYAEDIGKLASRIRFLRERRIDGLLLFPLLPTPLLLEAIRDCQKDLLPVVLVNEQIEGIDCDVVLVDNASASFRAVEQLVLNRHRHIAIIDGTEADFVSKERLRGYCEALAAYSMPCEKKYQAYADHSSVKAYNVTRNLLSMPEPPTAIFVTGYRMGYGVLTAIRDAGLAIGRDIAVTCFDRTEFIDLFRPAITVIEQPLDQMGQAAADLMLGRITRERAGPPERIQLNTRMLPADPVTR